MRGIRLFALPAISRTETLRDDVVGSTLQDDVMWAPLQDDEAGGIAKLYQKKKTSQGVFLQQENNKKIPRNIRPGVFNK